MIVGVLQLMLAGMLVTCVLPRQRVGLWESATAAQICVVSTLLSMSSHVHVHVHTSMLRMSMSTCLFMRTSTNRHNGTIEIVVDIV